MDSSPSSGQDLGEQPLAGILISHALTPHDLVLASTEQITHKMVARAVKGRRLGPRVQAKICRALNNATGRRYALPELFTY